jgi:hypothetical protein
VTDKPARSRRRSPETPGDRLRTAIVSQYELDPAERLLLDQAAALADALARVNAEVAAAESLAAKGSRGQLVASPLLAAQRQHAEVLARVLEALALPATPDEEEGEGATTRKARRAAQARWAKQKEARRNG